MHPEMSGSETGGVMTSGRGEPFVSPAGAQNMRLTFSDGTPLYKPVAVTGAAPTAYQAPSTARNGGSIEGSAGGGPPLPHGLNMNTSGGEPVKKKRGRPRKYGPDGTMSLTLTPGTTGSVTPQTAGFPSQSAAVAAPSGGSVSPSTAKKSRGRPPGSGRKKQLESLGINESHLGSSCWFTYSFLKKILLSDKPRNVCPFPLIYLFFVH